ncbi:MAG: peptidase S41, partial [Rhodospirillales bacterium]
MRWIAIAAATALGFFTFGQVQAESSKSARDTYKQLELFGTVLDRIRADYVEEVSDAELIKAAIDGMLSSLDPHSSYLDEEERQRLDVDTR